MRWLGTMKPLQLYSIYVDKGEASYHFLWKHLPKRNFLTETINDIAKELNWGIVTDLKYVTEIQYITTDFSLHESILKFDSQLERCILRNYAGDPGDPCPDEGSVCRMALAFGPRIAKILGFEPGRFYPIYFPIDVTNIPYVHVARYPHALGTDTNYLFCYSDIVEPTRFE